MSKKKLLKLKTQHNDSSHKKIKKHRKKSKVLSGAVKASEPIKKSDKGQTALRSKKKSKLALNKKKNKPCIKKAEIKSTKDSNLKSSLGTVSSDSDLEPIQGDWSLGNEDSENSSVVSGANENRTTDIPHSPLSDDLEESETDEDEELDESELNALLNLSEATSETNSGLGKQKKREVAKLKTSNDLDSAKHNKKSVNRKQNMTTAELATTANSGIESHKPSFDWTDEASLLSEIQRRASDVSSRTLYISPIPANCTMEILRRLSPTAVSCRLSYNPKTKTCRRYAFLEYADSESAVAAKKTLSGRLFAGANLCVQPGRSQIPTGTGALERVDRKQLFICGLHQSVTKADLHQAFPKAEIDYPFNSDGFPLGYASAKFVNEEVALEAFKNVHGRRIRGCLVSVNFTMKSAKPVEKTLSNSKSSSKPVEHTTSSVSKEVDSSKTTVVSIIPPASPTHPATDTQLNANALPGTKPKVIIQQIVEPDSDDDSVDASKGIFLQKDSTEPLLYPTDADKPAVHPTSIISQLIRSTKKRKARLLTNTEDQDGEESIDNSEDTKDELSTSKSEKSDASSEESEVANSDDEDADSASVEESASASEENTKGDSDDQISEGGDEESKREDECISGGLQSHLESALFSCPPTAEEKAKLPSTCRSSDEEVDNTLMAVMRARKGAARALKTAGSKRKWRGDGNAQLQRTGAKKFIKPYELPVPTKKNKKTLIG